MGVALRVGLRCDVSSRHCHRYSSDRGSAGGRCFHPGGAGGIGGRDLYLYHLLRDPSPWTELPWAATAQSFLHPLWILSNGWFEFSGLKDTLWPENWMRLPKLRMISRKWKWSLCLFYRGTESLFFFYKRKDADFLSSFFFFFYFYQIISQWISKSFFNDFYSGEKLFCWPDFSIEEQHLTCKLGIL